MAAGLSFSFVFSSPLMAQGDPRNIAESGILNRLVGDAHAAQFFRKCERFERAVKELENIKTSPSTFGLPGGASEQMQRDAAARARQLRAEGCPPRTTMTGTGAATMLAGARGTLYQPSVEVGIDLSANTIKLPARSFLGTEVNGSFQPELGLVTPDDGGDGIGIRGFIKLDTTNVFNLPFGQKPPKTSFVRLGVDRLNFNVKQGLGGIDPGANTDLLIPGPLGGASGFSIGPNAVVTGGQYGLDYSQTGLYGDIGIESDYPDWAYPTHLTGYVRGGVYDIRVDERFSGVIAAFNREFGYGTHVDATRYIYGVGIEGRSRIARFSTPSEQDYWDLALRYAGEFGGFHVNGNGTDSLSFTGFPTSAAHLDASDSGTYYKLGVGLEVTAGPMKSHLMFGYENMPAVPVIVRDGNNPSQLTFGDSDAWSVKFGVSVGFGGVPGNYRF
jgi:hypothetical protein